MKPLFKSSIILVSVLGISLCIHYPLSSQANQFSTPTGKKAILHIAASLDFELTGDTAATAWSKTTWTDLVQTNQTNALRQTRVKIMYSTTGIYCLFWCEDPTITATLQKDFEDLYNEDVVEFFFWTDENHPLYFEYELSPLNHELAILVPNHQGVFFGWAPWHYEGECLTRHKTTILKSGDQTTGWVAECFIPYTLLKPLGNVPPKKGTTWRANMYRLDYDNDQTRWSWQPIRKNFHDYNRFGTILFD